MAYLSVSARRIEKRDGSRFVYVRAEAVPSLSGSALRGEVEDEGFLDDLKSIALELPSSPFQDWNLALAQGEPVSCRIEGNIADSKKAVTEFIIKRGSLLHYP
jgi:hypothetical protein